MPLLDGLTGAALEQLPSLETVQRQYIHQVLSATGATSAGLPTFWHHPAHAVPLDRMSTAVQDGGSLGYSRPSSIPPRLRSTLWQAPCG
ncbi:hypothetical protein ULG90_09350 [Halopseudomonas pachastrellae]|nr:hypothetical protein ULG90_09350 [Halopseudomonas pachastrellae]